MSIFDFIPAVKNNEEATRLNELAQKTITDSETKLKNAKSRMKSSFEEYGALKLQVLSTTVYSFVENFEKIKNVELSEKDMHQDMKNINMMKENFQEMKQASINVKELTAGGITALGSGALAGAAAYGGVGMLATASTGTAIGTLSGAAATNATLAWLGGGSLAAGGGGMAAGAIVLGGIVTAPVLIIGYVIFHSKSKTKLAEAKTNNLAANKYRKEIKLAISKMKAITDRVEQMEYTLNKIDRYFQKSVGTMEYIINKYGADFTVYPENEQKEIYKSVMFAQTTKALLDVNLLKKNGELESSSLEVLESTKNFLISYDKK